MNSFRVSYGGAVIALLALGVAGVSSAADKPRAATSKGPDIKVFQEATAVAIGNLARESVTVEELHQEGTWMKWKSTTPLGLWSCQATPEGKKSYCERQAPAPRPAASAPAAS